ncbi:MAG: peptidylprolyl isomerase [Bacteroidales bacterium]|nr:peptidylprolyl isomerase [Bacteroidales bacterium]
MNLFKISLLLLTIMYAFSCSDDVNNSSNFNNGSNENIYKSDKTSQTIVNFHQSGDVTELVKYLNNDNSEYQILSLYALASLKDTTALLSITGLLTDENPNVRNATAYALGCFENPVSEQKLIDAFNSESEKVVKKTILEALGKCGTEESMTFVASLNIDNSEKLLQQGQARAFYFLAKNDLISQQIIDIVISTFNNQDIDEETKLAYSYFLTVDNNINISKSFNTLKYEIENRKNVYLLCNLTLGLKHIKSQESLNLLSSIIGAETDYRIKVCAIESLYTFDYNSGKKAVFEALKSNNSALTVAASEYIFKKGNANDVQQYLNYSDQITSMQARSNLYRAALYYASNKKPITNKIISGYNVTNNIYEKASLLYALSADPLMYKFVKDETFSTQYKIISTEGIKALYMMRLHPDFEKLAWIEKEKSGNDLHLEFRIIFKEAMTSGDNAMVYYAAKIMNKFGDEYFDEFTNTFFLTQAFNALKVPQDFASYKELCKTINKYGSQTCSKNVNIEAPEIDWDYISSIPGNQRVSVETNKGVFEITLDVNSSPKTVGKFLELTQQSYYDNTFFYRNIPNSVIVTGGKRGDGWMNTNTTLIAEFKDKQLKEGSVAMTIITDNEEYTTTNWFVSTSESLDLSDKYAVFGQVTTGMEVVHQLEVGDFIIHVKIL